MGFKAARLVEFGPEVSDVTILTIQMLMVLSGPLSVFARFLLISHVCAFDVIQETFQSLLEKGWSFTCHSNSLLASGS